MKLMAMVFGVVAAVHVAPVLAADHRFVISASGEEVTDTRTALIWRRCVLGRVWANGTCTGSAFYYIWSDSYYFIERVNVESGVNWRLPNVKELQTLVDRGFERPAIDSGVFPNTPTAHYWTSTPHAVFRYSVWVVGFGDGNVALKSRNRDSFGVLRLVRDAP